MAWPSGKAGACKASIPSSNLGATFSVLTLYIVSTPIGNLSDLSSRALEVLKNVDIICCEDTRVSSKLLKSYSIHKPLVSCHKFSEAKKVSQIIEKLDQGLSIALISDAGTPVIQDPGWRLVNAAREAEIEITAIPGPCAIINALTLVGWPVDRFEFRGYLPKKASQRETCLKEAVDYPGITVFYVSSHEIMKVMEALLVLDIPVPIGVIKEMTKLHERVIRGDVQDVANALQEVPEKGEYVLLVGFYERETSDEELEVAFMELLDQGTSFSNAVSIIAEKFNVSKNKLYNRFKK